MKRREIRGAGAIGSSISRRVALQGMGSIGLAAGLTVPFSGRSLAADPITLRWWSPQASPAQLKMYQAQIATFEGAHPGVKIAFEPTSDEGYPAQLAAAFAAKQLPNIITHLPSFAAQNYYGQGLLEPMDDVIKAVGEADYFAGANDVYKTSDGHYCGTPIGNTAADMLWLRKDLMAKAGVAQGAGDLERTPGGLPEDAGRAASMARRFPMASTA